MILMEFDKSGAEWVVVAYLSGDARMLDVVESGKDPHLVTGSLISSVPEDLVAHEDKLVGKNTDPDEINRRRLPIGEALEGTAQFLPRSMSIRQAGKKSNHGLNYNMRYKRFALENEIEEAEAKLMVSQYREVAYPGVPQWHKSIEAEMRRDRTMTNCFGRKVTLRDQWGPDLLDAAYSFKPQSTVGDIVNRAMIAAYDDTSPVFASMDLLTQTHDSATVQYPTDDWVRMADFAIRFGLGYMSPELEYNQRKFTIGTDLKIGLDWGNMVEVELIPDAQAVAKNLQHGWHKLHDAEEVG